MVAVGVEQMQVGVPADPLAPKVHDLARQPLFSRVKLGQKNSRALFLVSGGET